jgi:hypothetical protein
MKCDSPISYSRKLVLIVHSSLTNPGCERVVYWDSIPIASLHPVQRLEFLRTITRVQRRGREHAEPVVQYTLDLTSRLSLETFNKQNRLKLSTSTITYTILVCRYCCGILNRTIVTTSETLSADVSSDFCIISRPVFMKERPPLYVIRQVHYIFFVVFTSDSDILTLRKDSRFLSSFCPFMIAEELPTKLTRST